MSTGAVSPGAAPARTQGVERERAVVAGALRSAQLQWWVAVAAILILEISLHSRTDPSTRFTVRTVGGASGISRFQEPIHGNLPVLGSGITPSDLLIFAFAFLALAHRIVNGNIAFSRRAANLTLAIMFPVVVGVAVGEFHGTHSPFSDWRNLFTGALFAAGLWSTVLRSEEGSFRFAQLFVAVSTAYAAITLVHFAQGGGNIAFYGRTTISDHAALEYVVAAVALSLAMLRTRRSTALWWSAIIIGSLTVTLSFRRYAWVEGVVVALVFIVLSTGAVRRRYVIAVAGLVAACALGIALTWSSLQWSERFASLDPQTTAASNSLAATNTGHLNDILDGIDQVRAHPIFGLGVGVQWAAVHTLGWKQMTGMVHNGPLDIWIKFGLFGLAMFLFVYAYLFIRIWAKRRGTGMSDFVAIGTGAFLLANLVVTLTVYEWSFAVPEGGILIFALIAASFPAVEVS